jgi:hypothetical protein
MKKLLLFSFLFVSSFCYAQNSNETMVQSIRQEGWIQGLFNTTDTMGTPVEVVDFKHPQPNMHQFNVILQTTPEVESVLKRHSSAKSVIPRLSIVVRMDAKSKLDEAYHLANARIVSVKPAKMQQNAEEVIISFDNVAKVSGTTMNPGPPSGAPTVQDTDMNLGWICDESTSGTISRTEVEIVDFTIPCFNGQLSVTFGKSVQEVQQLFQSPASMRELILVLPDRDLHRYVEFKLWDVKGTAVPGDEYQIVFKADMIECLTGEGISNELSK